ncbi:decapping endonuclease targeting mRNA [Apophysomyces ossiformis]|uniref:Decapping nuclease n=1 Tax=Apophysomyces ossiformis TaxID=679940 RepID=A0A8H7BGT2_9FUNG|nr:decapping endonuclease targeting mRNA [Apophysomyces ossiformis]
MSRVTRRVEDILSAGFENLTLKCDTRTFAVAPFRSYITSHLPPNDPQEITSFSLDSKLQVWFDDRELRYYYAPTGKNLMAGYEQYEERDPSLQVDLDSLLDALTHLQKQSKDPDLVQADIVAWRSTIAKFMRIPYSRSQPFAFRATRYKGTVFIEEVETEKRRVPTRIRSDHEKRMCYSGVKFESLCTVSTPEPDKKELEERLTSTAEGCAMYYSVIKTRMGATTLIVGSKIDCIEGKKPAKGGDPTSQYVELATTKAIVNDRHQHNFERHKLLKYWAQSYLAGIPRVVCGFRDEDGQLERIKDYKTSEIPNSVRTKHAQWVSDELNW